MRKLIALDVDGTLLNSDNKITDRTREVLEKAQDAGHTLVIASGRDPIGVAMYADMLNFDKHNGLICTFNGAKVIDYETKEVLIDHSIDLDTAKEILAFAEENSMTYLLYTDTCIVTNSEDTYAIADIAHADHNTYKVVEDLSYNIDFSPNKILFSIDPSLIDDKIKLFDERFEGKFSTSKSTTFFYEVMPKGIDKGKSLIEMAKYLGIDIKDTIAIGDERNDLAMLKAAGVGVVMGNAPDVVKEIADYITKSNDEDGIAYYIENELLNK
ncbi:Cof-type HAD-IIB family hydrolase [Anaerococcus sp. NML200537]|uniref:Cof-type HAD-IIB family hydrolase n=1 Tax=Anaerococcus sp. NML200537 TaxID=2954485 RepID=UPI002237B87C|nr:Cof-type HAD-IIB family hydrolase [Anaerococcus sp. NML200537]MCW6701158.1 Cof-type HAD-IIB family hydrolase [Anaerococcus sp. NML200537]